jgi:hypothetical protein
MTQAVTERWEVEELAECLRCGGEMTIAPVLAGIELNGSYVCHPCYFFVFDGSKARAAQALGLEPSGDGDDDPTPGPAAPAVRPGTLWLLIAGQSVARELTPEEEREWDDFLRAVEEDRERCPLEECQTCRRPASPLIEGECLTCRGELLPPAGPRPDRTDLAAVWLDTLRELAEAKAILARIDARLAAR